MDGRVEPGHDSPGWRHTTPGAIDSLQVIYKVAERCNINCSYCYYFNMGEETALTRPAVAPLPVTEALAEWIAQGCAELAIPHAKVTFHGGEPTLMGVRAFGEACRMLRAIIAPVAELSLSIQTNGVLVNDAWIEAFLEHRVAVGVSIDGEAAANDRFRLDHRGRSTFNRTEAAIRRLTAAYSRGGPVPATISVVHPANDYGEVYRYLRGLGVMSMGFLLPDRNVDDVAFDVSGDAAAYGVCLSEIFVEWLREDNPDVRIKFIDQMLPHFRPELTPGAIFHRARKMNQVVIARTDGTVAIDDTYIPALGWYETTPVYRVGVSTLRDFLGDPVLQEIEAIQNTLPAGCLGCRWRAVCRGGDVENRFSARNGFDNPSVYCGAYKVMYQDVCDTLVGNGYPAALVGEKFGVS